jgi:hypothetical protein
MYDETGQRQPGDHEPGPGAGGGALPGRSARREGALVEDAGGRIAFVYDTDYEQAAQALQAEIVQEYVALALKVALVRQGYRVQETAGQQGTRSIVGVMG